jgi:hypothetical protein
MPYNAKLDAGKQIDMEEQIAAMIFDHDAVETDEETAADLGRAILRAVLTAFRPDVITK